MLIAKHLCSHYGFTSSIRFKYIRSVNVDPIIELKQPRSPYLPKYDIHCGYFEQFRARRGFYNEIKTLLACE